MRKISTVALLAIIICMASCKKDALKGINTDALFATPTAQEIETIQNNISQRNHIPTDLAVENSYDINSKVVLKMISFRLYGYKQYAAVLLPITAAKPLPVQIYVWGFSLDKPYSYQNIKLVSDTASLPFVYIMPALRGQSLTMVVNDVTYTTPTSEGTREDAFDGATDDAIASLNAVGALFTQADTSVVGVRGGSRGATVALLMAERDKRVKRAVGIAVPADLLSSTKTHQNDPTYRFQFLDALINGTATLQETRTKLIASSPLYFCSWLPKSQIHFGQNDDITPTTEGDKMVNAMLASGHSDSLEMFVYKDRDHTSIGNDNTEMENRVKAFFSALW